MSLLPEQEMMPRQVMRLKKEAEFYSLSPMLSTLYLNPLGTLLLKY